MRFNVETKDEGKVSTQPKSEAEGHISRNMIRCFQSDEDSVRQMIARKVWTSKTVQARKPMEILGDKLKQGDCVSPKFVSVST